MGEKGNPHALNILGFSMLKIWRKECINLMTNVKYIWNCWIYLFVFMLIFNSPNDNKLGYKYTGIYENCVNLKFGKWWWTYGIPEIKQHTMNFIGKIYKWKHENDEWNVQIKM